MVLNFSVCHARGSRIKLIGVPDPDLTDGACCEEVEAFVPRRNIMGKEMRTELCKCVTVGSLLTQRIGAHDKASVLAEMLHSLMTSISMGVGI